MFPSRYPQAGRPHQFTPVRRVEEIGGSQGPAIDAEIILLAGLPKPSTGLNLNDPGLCHCTPVVRLPGRVRLSSMKLLDLLADKAG